MAGCETPSQLARRLVGVVLARMGSLGARLERELGEDEQQGELARLQLELDRLGWAFSLLAHVTPSSLAHVRHHERGLEILRELALSGPHASTAQELPQLAPLPGAEFAWNLVVWLAGLGATDLSCKRLPEGVGWRLSPVGAAAGAHGVLPAWFSEQPVSLHRAAGACWLQVPTAWLIAEVEAARAPK